MLKQLKMSLFMLLTLAILTGMIYPLVITAAAQTLFPTQANGSLVTDNGRVVGSSLIGQANNDARYFWLRPSVTNYNPLPSSGSNLGPTSAALKEVVINRSTDFREVNDLSADVSVPTEMLFASGSGLDPHISPEAARMQIDRIAKTRGLAVEHITALVEKYIEQPQLGILGQPRVNVLLLNLALDELE